MSVGRAAKIVVWLHKSDEICAPHHVTGHKHRTCPVGFQVLERFPVPVGRVLVSLTQNIEEPDTQRYACSVSPYVVSCTLREPTLSQFSYRYFCVACACSALWLAGACLPPRRPHGVCSVCCSVAFPCTGRTHRRQHSSRPAHRHHQRLPHEAGGRARCQAGFDE